MRILLFLMAVFIAAPAEGQTRRIQMFTGETDGVYFPVGGALCRLMNEGRVSGDARCRVRASAGGAANLRALAAGEARLAIAQGDWVAAAVRGTGPFEGAPILKLRIVGALHQEALTIVTARRGPDRLSRLAGRVVNLGSEDSSQRLTFAAALASNDMAEADLGRVEALDSAEAVIAVCEQQIDAAVFVTGHPSALIDEAAELCEIAVMEAWNRPMRRYVNETTIYGRGITPGDIYRGVDRDRESLGTPALLVAHADAPEAEIRRLTQAMVNGAVRLGGFHPALAGVTPERMAAGRNFGDLHPGAAGVYREAGLIE